MPSPVDITAGQISDTGKQRSFSPGIREIKWSTNYQNGPSRFSTWDGVKPSRLAQPTAHAAAAKAKTIYLALKSSGWEITLANFKPKSQIHSEIATTVGEFLEQVVATAGRRPKTIQGYCRAFRKIIADIFKIDEGQSKFDYRAGGGREKWLARIHAVKLKDLTPNKIQKWKVAFVVRAGTDPTKRRVAQISVNSLMRQMWAVFLPA